MRIKNLGNFNANMVVVEEADGSRYLMNPERVKEARPGAKIVSWANGTKYTAPVTVEGDDLPVEIASYDRYGNGALDAMMAAAEIDMIGGTEGDITEESGDSTDAAGAGKPAAAGGKESGPGNAKSAKADGG